MLGKTHFSVGKFSVITFAPSQNLDFQTDKIFKIKEKENSLSVFWNIESKDKRLPLQNKRSVCCSSTTPGHLHFQHLVFNIQHLTFNIQLHFLENKFLQKKRPD